MTECKKNYEYPYEAEIWSDYTGESIAVWQQEYAEGLCNEDEAAWSP